MRQSSGSYTRFISVTKIILPLIAIGLLATVFLFTKEQKLEGGLRFSAADLAKLESGLRITEPRFSGQNAAGDTYNFGAEVLSPDSLSPTHIVATGLSGEIQYVSGQTAYLSASVANYDIEEEVLDLSGEILIELSDGTVATAKAMVADLETGQIISDGPITASSPMGSISAGSFRLENITQYQEENQMIWFENGVTLRFRPESWDSDKVGDE